MFLQMYQIMGHLFNHLICCNSIRIFLKKVILSDLVDPPENILLHLTLVRFNFERDLTKPGKKIK